MNRHIAIYPGSFDPFTNGHLDIVNRGLEIFEKLIIAVACNSEKNGFFTFQERVDLITELVADNPRVEVEALDGLLVDYVVKKEARVILRGLRAVSDFEFEFQLAQMNHTVCEQVETLFMMTSPECAYLSSSVVKEVGRLGGDVSKFVPPPVLRALQKKFAEMK
ncbi:Phosphopantetheine adenylyltransferase [Malonomonas rubra DSM 5091]|uniref:Phosphopantetheine adenylyltransferase n=1 Tax=Malonomonas rubra DSM 5091 TaxID=1122189 RepID=A0A1M6K8M9_MALRU|nr:pantetheine-phosphate adenylyltransferase [Malonomonas rubra]SHJ55217.1 Phosphopantetheine adenylyltransferase [Malonomonas rubra DSM 5091]